MRVLLINSNRFKQPWPVIPFGLCCVASSLEEAGHTVEMLDLCFSYHPAKEIAGAVKEFEPEVVGVSIRNIDNSAGYNTQFLLEDVRQDVIAPLKQVFDGPIVIGGPSVGISAREILEYLDLEYAIRGDGEAAMIEFLRRLERSESLARMGSLVQRQNTTILQDNPPMKVHDLDKLPMARVYRYVDVHRYRKYGSPLQIQTKRGCALSCTYCTYNQIEGRHWRLRDPELVADEIEDMVKHTGIRHVEFTDSTFNIPLDHCKAVLRAIITKKMNLKMRTMGLNPGAVDEDLVELLKQAGFCDVDLGAESGCDRTLAGLGKNFCKSQVLRAGELLRAKGIPVTWYLLVGGPGETTQTLAETFATMDQAAGMWDLVNIGVGVRVYNGSPIAKALRDQHPSVTQDNFLSPVAYEPEALSLDKVKALTKQAALMRTNYFMYDEDETIPVAVLALGSWLMQTFAPRQPIWRLFIVLRYLQKALGINLLRRVAHKLASRQHLRPAKLRDIRSKKRVWRLTRERLAQVLVGGSILAIAALSYFHSPLWLLGAAGIALNLMVTGIANRCVIKNLLKRMGFQGEWDLGYEQGLRESTHWDFEHLTDKVPRRKARRISTAMPDFIRSTTLSHGKEAVT